MVAKRAVSRLYEGTFDEGAVRAVAREAREELGCEPTLGLVFATTDYVPHLEDFLEIVRLHAHLPILAGGSAQGLAGTDREMEDKPGFSLLLLHLPGATVRAVTLPPAAVEDAAAGASSIPAIWHRATGVARDAVKAWLVLADPFSFPVEKWMPQWNDAYPGVPVFGGLASGLASANESWVFHDGEAVEGAVALAFGGDIDVHTVVSQGCKPIGEPYTITSVDQNVLYTLGSQPAYKILDGAFQGLSEEEKEHARGHLFAGLAMSEYVEEFKRGDFLVRSILGADPNTGAVAIAAKPRVGQTLQYQLRDAEAASGDLHFRLLQKQAELKEAGAVPFASFLCTCNGRGIDLFGDVSHDAKAVGRYFPGVPLAGFFANGEFGPVGRQSYVHGYTAAVALFCTPAPAPVPAA